jgi:dienelactone hydrolase
MIARRVLMFAAMLIVVSAVALAQMTSKTPLLDSRGKPLPFGVPAYHKPNVPLGAGPYKAVMSEEKGLSAHVTYYPADLARFDGKKLPVVVWANGSCLYAGNRYRQYLTEIASHGYLVIAGGPMGPVELEVGPQENPQVRRPGTPAPIPAANTNASNSTAEPRVTTGLLKEAVDWVMQQNANAFGKFNNKIDLGHVVVMGHSCGGGLAIQEAAQDSRVSALGIWFSGAGLTRGNDAGLLEKIKVPVLIISGAEDLDVAYGNAKSTFERIDSVPVFYGWRDELEHIGTFGAANGGELGAITVKWLDWQTRSNPEAGKVFKGTSCTLCKDPAWHIQKKKM